MANETKAGYGTVALELMLAWLAVGVPLAWGVVETLQKAFKLFVRA